MKDHLLLMDYNIIYCVFLRFVPTNFLSVILGFIAFIIVVSFCTVIKKHSNHLHNLNMFTREVKSI